MLELHERRAVIYRLTLDAIEDGEENQPRDSIGRYAKKPGAGKMPAMEKSYLSNEAAQKFYEDAIADRTVEKKAALGKLTNASAVAAAIGKDVTLEEVILQASYLAHVHDYHGPGGYRKDANPVVAADIPLALTVINGDTAPQFTGELSCAEQPLVKFTMTIKGVTYKVIGEVRPGRRNRNVAVYNFYKR